MAGWLMPSVARPRPGASAAQDEYTCWELGAETNRSLVPHRSSVGPRAGTDRGYFPPDATFLNGDIKLKG